MPSPVTLDRSRDITCITCRVLFANADLQRMHYQNEWHRYNLKRKVVELPPINLEQFEKRLLSYRKAEDEEPVINRCEYCNKSFQTTNSYNNHLKSKKHQEISANFEKMKAIPNMSCEKNKQDINEEENWTDVDDNDENVDNIEVESIEISTCFFCGEKCQNMEINLEHMSKKHDFYVHDLEFCIDLEGILEYFGKKIGVENVCLYCNEKGKKFHTLDACQKHMRNLGHCRVKNDQECLLELADFYDFGNFDGDNEVNVHISDLDILNSTGWQLQLPSGATIGHRSLMRYYRQKLRPESDIKQTKKSRKDLVEKLGLGQCKSLGWNNSTSGAMIVQKAKDMNFMKKLYAKKQLKLGEKANKLFVFRGRED